MKTFTFQQVVSVQDRVLQELKDLGAPQTQIDIVHCGFLILRCELLLAKNSPVPPIDHSESGTFRSEHASFILVDRIIRMDYSEAEKRVLSSLLSCTHGFADPRLCQVCNPLEGE